MRAAKDRLCFFFTLFGKSLSLLFSSGVLGPEFETTDERLDIGLLTMEN
jgi:hypothetical protein